MIPITLPPAMDNIGHSEFFNCGMVTNQVEGKSEFEPVELCLNIDFVLHPTHKVRLVNTSILLCANKNSSVR